MQRQIIKRISELYITERKKHIVMYVNAEGEADYSHKFYRLSDKSIGSHVRKKSTIGVFAGQYLTSFICFDVDTDSQAKARSITYKLVDLLMEDYHIHQKHIHVSSSGSKGYHVEIFFNKPIGNRSIEKFHDDVCKRIGLIEGKIELRPTATQGVKLPLSIHRGTNNVCWYVDTITLEPIEDEAYILGIEQIDTEDFKNLVFNEVDRNEVIYFDRGEAEQVEELIRETNIDNKPLQEVRDDIERVLEANRLIRNGTRNNMTFLIALYLHNEGWRIDDVKARIVELLDNTWNLKRDFISKSTSYEYMMAEVNRITNTVYKYNYILGMTKARIEITKGELLQIVGLETERYRKTIYLKKLLFSLLVHSKKFARKDGCFYMPYSVMTKYGNAQDRATLLEYIDELVKLGMVEVIQRNEINKALSKERGHIMSEANIYRVTLKDIGEPASITLRTDEKIDFFEITSRLIPKKEIKKILTRTVYDKQFKEYYDKKAIV